MTISTQSKTVATKKQTFMPVAQPEANPEFVTTAQFNKLTDVISKLVDKIDVLDKKTATPIETKEAVEVKKAGWDQAPLNPVWEDKAREIIGEALDHCEVLYPNGGGTIFTVVIKADMSNAPKSYLEFYKLDRRSREIGNEGLAGIENFCKLVRQNLRRPNK